MNNTSDVSHRIYRNAGNRAVLAMVPREARTVLDVGCGGGDNAAILQQRRVMVDAVTLSLAELDLVRPLCRRVLLHDVENGLPDGLADAYDCCVCSHVLEHICWPRKLLADIRQKLLPSRGVLIVALPNLLNYKNRLRLLAGRFDYQESGLMDDTHFRWYTFRTAQNLLADSGFDVETATAEGAVPLWRVRRALPKLARRLDQFGAAMWPGLFGWQLLFAARPRM